MSTKDGPQEIKNDQKSTNDDSGETNLQQRYSIRSNGFQGVGERQKLN